MPEDNTAPRLRADISPMLFGECTKMYADAIVAADPLGVGLVKMGSDTLNSMYSALGDCKDALRAEAAAAPPTASQNPGGTSLPPDRAENLAIKMQIRFDKVASVVQTNIGSLRQRRDELSKKLDASLAPAKTPDAHAFGAEVRAHVKHLPGKSVDKMTFVLNAIRGGDKETAAAIIGSRPFLSGLDETQVSTLRAAAALAFAPGLSAGVREADRLIAHVAQGSETFVREFAKLKPKVVHYKRSNARDALAKLATG
jgi:hypothetical protein